MILEASKFYNYNGIMSRATINMTNKTLGERFYSRLKDQADNGQLT